MKLTTDILPRRDGTLSATVPATADAPSSSYVFNADADGRLVCAVTCEAHIGWLLDTGNFYPVDEGDIDAGIKAVAAQEPAANRVDTEAVSYRAAVYKKKR